MKICEPLVDIEDKSELKNWSSEFIAALADWYDRFVMEDNIVSSVFKPTGTQNKAFVQKKEKNEHNQCYSLVLLT